MSAQPNRRGIDERGLYFKSAEILPFSDWLWFQLGAKGESVEVKILYHEGEHVSDGA